MKFTKMHGCGNDYIYIDGFKETVADESAAAIKLSDRHFSIGGDGLIIIKKGTKADFEMVMYNADGSRGAMCGNGIRCVAKYVYDHGHTDKSCFSIESMGAVKYIDVSVENGKAVSAKVDMGKPALKAADIPVVSKDDKAIMQNVNIDGREFKMTCVSMGNPHAVMFIDEHPKDFDLNRYGAFMESNTDLFPDRVNAEFAKIIDRNNIEMRVYERGSGETLACGTGACATAVAAILSGLADNDVTIHLIGGDLNIHWDGSENSSVFMTGPAEYAFSGEVEL
ncbi:MAG: diaminopimelate epimerase [Acetobacter sp.]|nr:diaminopimelate epimerase [Bacteroides sp.]MCM1340970.1 diaminopimelate epimerase [Acetobacter sp.]MCM1432474.1 diaminopimelate epimerase [Clostridiales bacterium]